MDFFGTTGGATAPPQILSFTPSSGGVGTVVTISGCAFGTQAVPVVSFGGTAATVTSATDLSIVVPVPAGATTGQISVTTANGSGYSTGNFTVTSAAPFISSLSITSGDYWSQLTINGGNFGTTQGTSYVRFGTTAPAEYVSGGWSNAAVTVRVPALAAGSFAVSLTVVGQTTAVGPNFTMLAPQITSFTPSSGVTGSSVTISGSSFGEVQGATVVRFGTYTATATNWAAAGNSITVTVPSGLSAGSSYAITVTTSAGMATSATNFTVTAATFSFVFSSDNRTDDTVNPVTTESFRYACDGMAAEATPIAIFAGDRCYINTDDLPAQMDAKYAAWHVEADKVLRTGVVGIHTAGNHEYIGTGTTYTNSTAAYRTNVYDWEALAAADHTVSGCHLRTVTVPGSGVTAYFLCLNVHDWSDGDGDSGWLSTADEAWVHTQLDTLSAITPTPWIMVVTHEAIADPKYQDDWYPGGPTDGQAPYYNAGTGNVPVAGTDYPVGSNAAQRTRLMGLFRDHGVSMVLGGHRHNYRRHMQDGISYVRCSPSGQGGSSATGYEDLDAWDSGGSITGGTDTRWGTLAGEVGSCCWLRVDISGTTATCYHRYKRDADAWLTHTNETWTQAKRNVTAPTFTVTGSSQNIYAYGAVLTISGTGFGATRGTSTVTIGGAAPLSYTSWSATQIVCVVGGMTSGLKTVAVTVGGVTINSPNQYESRAPTINTGGLSPSTGVVNTPITIAGNNFGTAKSTSIVQFDAITATSSWNSNTSISATVPATATGTEPVSVTTAAGKSNTQNFVVTTGGDITFPPGPSDPRNMEYAGDTRPPNGSYTAPWGETVTMPTSMSIGTNSRHIGQNFTNAVVYGNNIRFDWCTFTGTSSWAMVIAHTAPGSAYNIEFHHCQFIQNNTGNVDTCTGKPTTSKEFHDVLWQKCVFRRAHTYFEFEIQNAYSGAGGNTSALDTFYNLHFNYCTWDFNYPDNWSAQRFPGNLDFSGSNSGWSNAAYVDGRGNIIENCLFKGCQGATGMGAGNVTVEMAGGTSSSPMTIRNNIFWRTYHECIVGSRDHETNFTPQPRHFVITGNVFDFTKAASGLTMKSGNNYADAIELYDGTNSAVYGTITNNLFYLPVTNPSNNITNVTCTGKTMSGNRGFYISGSTSTEYTTWGLNS